MSSTGSHGMVTLKMRNQNILSEFARDMAETIHNENPSLEVSASITGRPDH